MGLVLIWKKETPILEKLFFEVLQKCWDSSKAMDMARFLENDDLPWYKSIVYDVMTNQIRQKVLTTRLVYLHCLKNEDANHELFSGPLFAEIAFGNAGHKAEIEWADQILILPRVVSNHYDKKEEVSDFWNHIILLHMM